MGAKCFWGSLVLMTCITSVALANVQSRVRCAKDSMEVDIFRSSPQAEIYLQQLKNYPDEACKPVLSDGVATFRLSLTEQAMSRCGITRVVNKVTGQKVYYHRIIVEEPDDSTKHTFTVKCIVTEFILHSEVPRNHTIVRRNILPAEFKEDDTIDFRGEINGTAPIPLLNVGVRQNGNLVTGELNVSPGTPLQMEIYLDNNSSHVYGLLVTYMQVTDTKYAEETIIFNGCSVDPYLFENFNTVDGDFLTAKFRAFKFPESTYVQFTATVNVCLDRCEGVECSSGQTGFGRKRRAITSDAKKEKFVYTTTTFMRVDWDENTIGNESLSHFVRKGTRRSAQAEQPVIAEEIEEQLFYKVTEAEVSASSTISISFLAILFFCMQKLL
ncbi:uncharacterized protein LOC107037030 [Diachasma alloeum]|uniref:uncharacterized protein LOC107037030 n=1 Tax=Diachasma alloeum TaxID=454923 RepID=UPI0007383E15|nr:uncharacterized protein LOC107037030 [Diachasma alloeum]